MARYSVGFEMDGSAVAVEMRWRRAPSIPWATIGTYSQSPAIFDIIDRAGRVEVNVRPLGADRRPLDAGESVWADPSAPILNRNDPPDLTPADPVVTQDGPVLTVVADVPAGENPDEYEVEVRLSDAGTSAPEDATFVGFVRPGSGVLAHVIAGEDTQRVHHRLVRREDGRASDWGTHDFETGRGEIEGTVGHSNDFASGTIVDLIDGFTPLEISGGDLQLVGIALDDFASSPGPGVALDDLGDISLMDLGVLPTRAAYRTDTVVLDAAEDLQFQVGPTLTSHGSLDFSLDDFQRFPLHWPEAPGGVFTDQRIPNMGRTLDGDTTPVEIAVKVSTSSSESPTFTANDYTAYQPGEVRYGVRAYSVEVEFRSRYWSQIQIDTIDIRHWVFCKARPWCHVGRDFQLIDETVLAADAAYLDLTVTGAEWDELALEIDWTNANASATRLAIRFNGSASEEVFLTESADALAAVDWHERMTAFLRPRIGDRRYVFVAQQHQYKATSVDDIAASTKVWDDTATDITSIRLITNQPASDYLGAGTRARLYGRREYGA